MSVGKNYFILILVIFCTNIQAYSEFICSAFLSNGFLVTSQYHQFNDQATKSHGKIFFPKLTNDNKLAVTNINTTIGDFIRNYQFDRNICNMKKCDLLYDVRTGSKENFTVKWQTKTYDDNGNEFLTKIETLNFNIADGKLLAATDILSPLAKDFMPEIIKLSKNHLAAGANWKEFLAKIANRQIQFYIFESQWYIIFNPNNNTNNQLIEIKLPAYLLAKNISL